MACSVYSEVYRDSNSSFDLYCVEIQRDPKDLGVSIVLPANCELMARREVFRLFPEFKHNLALIQVYLAKYAEIDWDSGRCIIAKRVRPPTIPDCAANTVKPKRNSLPPIQQEGTE